MSIQYIEKDFKSIINKYKFIDSWFWCRYSINTYNGCEFGCTYCDSRSHKYHLHSEYDQVIYVKTNVKSILDSRLTRARTLLPDVVAISGSCDPYQQAEGEFKNTRQCLKVLIKHKYPVLIGTKSTLVTRDLDLLTEINESTWCAVSITVTTTNADLSRFLEPTAPSPKARFETVKQLKDGGLTHVGINLIPIVPFLGDSYEDLENVTIAAKNAGADYILFGGGMTMRDNQARWYLKKLKELHPELVERYLDLYQARLTANGEYIGKYTPKKSYMKKIHNKMFELCDKYNLNYRIKRFIPEDYRKINYLLAELFLNEAYVLQSTGRPWSNLFWAGQNIQNLRESILDIYNRNELQKIRNITPELENRITEFLIEQKSIQQTIL